VRSATDAIGWGVKDAMDELWAEHVGGLTHGYTKADLRTNAIGDGTFVAAHVRCLG
jgi:hypothetical protein